MRNDYLGTNKRICASLLDSILLILLSFLLLLSSNLIIKNTTIYQSNLTQIQSLRNEIYEITKETNIYTFNKDSNGNDDYDNLISKDDMFIKYALSNCLYTYSLNRNEWDEKYGEENNPLYLKEKYSIEEASYSNDYLATFFVNYAPKYNENNNLFTLKDNETYISHYKNLLKENSNECDIEYYENTDQLPSLKLSFAYNVFRNIEKNETDGDKKKDVLNYTSLYFQIFSIASNSLFNSDRYQSFYTLYLNYYRNCSLIVDASCIIDYLLAYLLIIILPSILFKNGKTIGLFLFKGKLINKEGLHVSKKEVFLYTLFRFFSFFPIMIFSCFFAEGVNSARVYPVFKLGNINISLFNVIALFIIFPIINLILTIVKKNKQDLSLLLSNTIIIDDYITYEYIEENDNENID